MQRVFAALSSLRCRLPAHLARAELSAGGIASRLSPSSRPISRPPSIPEAAGLATGGKRGQFVSHGQVWKDLAEARPVPRLPRRGRRCVGRKHAPRGGARAGLTRVSTRPLSGAGSIMVGAPAHRVLAALLDPAVLQSLIPGAQTVEQLGHGHFRAVLSFGIGSLRSRNTVELRAAGLDGPGAVTLTGHAAGAHGAGNATGQVMLDERRPGRTSIAWTYAGEVSGRWVNVGGPLLRFSANLFVSRFFRALAGVAAGSPTATHPSG